MFEPSLVPAQINRTVVGRELPGERRLNDRRLQDRRIGDRRMVELAIVSRPSSLQILLADEQPLMRQGLMRLLGSNFPEVSFIEAASLAQVVAALDSPASHTGTRLLIANLKMPGMNGVATLGVLREKYPELKIAVLSAVQDRDTILDCLTAGAHGYLPTVDAPGKTGLAVRIVTTGGIYVPPQMCELAHVAGSDADNASARRGPRGIELTGRQGEVMQLLAAGRSTKEIARALDLGLGTVKVHLNGLYRRLGATNRTEAVIRFRDLVAAQGVISH